MKVHSPNLIHSLTRINQLIKIYNLMDYDEFIFAE